MEVNLLIIAVSVPNLFPTLRLVAGLTADDRRRNLRGNAADQRNAEDSSHSSEVDKLVCTCCGRYELAGTSTAVHEMACSSCGLYELASIPRADAELDGNSQARYELTSNTCVRHELGGNLHYPPELAGLP